MAKEIYLYGDVTAESSLNFIKELEASRNDDIVVRVNTPGGDPTFLWGIAAKYADHKFGKTIKVDGKANSTGFFLMAVSDNTEAVEEAQFWLHRAAYPAKVEAAGLSAAQQQNLDMINSSLRAALEAKIDTKVLERITGKTLDQIFSNSGRLDVILTASQAKEIGLIDRVVKITAQEQAMIEAKYESVFASSDFNHKQEPKQAKQMTIDALKAEHPDLFNQVFNAGVSKERDRVGAWATYTEADPEAVTAGIKNGSELSLTAMAELNMKMFKATQTKALVAESPVAVATAAVETPVAEADKKVEAFYNELIS
jgi:ATP-dependent protease ClpP protease subunit